MHPTTIEVLAISPAVDTPASIRDVFSGRPSLNLNDDSDWVDEDDDGPAYAGGLGQLPTSMTPSNWRPLSASSITSPASDPPSTPFSPVESPVTLSAPPKSTNSRNSTKKGRNNSTWANGGANGQKTRGKADQSPLPIDSFNETSDNRGTRRALPGGRSNGPSFKASVIQEEDEGEE